MRTVVTLIIFALPLCLPRGASAQSSGDYGDDFDSYETRLRRERYETAIAREETERARLANQRRSYDYQDRVQDIYARRAEQQRERDMRNSDISTVNQAASTAANIAQQVQILSGSRYGW